MRERRVLHGRRGHLYTARLAGARWARSPEPPRPPRARPLPRPRTDMRRLTGAQIRRAVPLKRTVSPTHARSPTANCEQISAFVSDKYRAVRPASSEYSMHNVSACPRSLSTHAACPDAVPLRAEHVARVAWRATADGAGVRIS